MLQTRDMMRKFAGCGAGRKAVLARVVKDFRPDFGGEGRYFRAIGRFPGAKGQIPQSRRPPLSWGGEESGRPCFGGWGNKVNGAMGGYPRLQDDDGRGFSLVRENVIFLEFFDSPGAGERD